jgi:ribosomal protein S18 acetylase RimI-like enzyme
MATRTVELVEPGDLVAMAQCMAIDADAFPYASAQFGVRAESARVWVARDEAGGRVTGFLAARLRRGVMHVEGVAVENATRRRGIGRALVRAAVEHARDEGLHAVGLHVSVTNPGAVALYEAEGFVVTRRIPQFYPPRAFDGERGALQMVLPLTSTRRRG